jgi:hypothetical protein
MLFKTTILTFFLVCLVSCGANKSTVPVKLKLFQGNLVAAEISNGGVVIVGRSDDGINSFRTSAPNTASVLSLNLPAGKWEFAAISWEGENGEPLRGNNRCAYTGFVDLKNSESSVSFNLTMARCKNIFSNNNQFADADHMDVDGKFLELFPAPCFSAVLNHNYCSTSLNQSIFLAYKISFKSEKKGAVEGDLNNLSTNCTTIGGASHLGRIPVIDAQIGSPFGSSISFYQDASCTGAPIVYDFKNGYKNNVKVPAQTSVDVLNQYSYLNINPGALFNNLPIEPTNSIQLMNGHIDNGSTYFNTTNIQYDLGPLPSGVAMMCVTTESMCNAGDWIAPQSVNTINISAVDGPKTLKVFFKSFAGVISTNPTSINFILDTTLPALSIFSATANVSLGVSIHWGTLLEDNFYSAFLHVCSDAACSMEIAPTQNITGDISIGNYTFSTIPGGLTSGNTIYTQMIINDKAGNQSVTTSPPIIINP